MLERIAGGHREPLVSPLVLSGSERVGNPMGNPANAGERHET